jgi:hypothetical protein
MDTQSRVYRFGTPDIIDQYEAQTESFSTEDKERWATNMKILFQTLSRLRRHVS